MGREYFDRARTLIAVRLLMIFRAVLVALIGRVSVEFKSMPMWYGARVGGAKTHLNCYNLRVFTRGWGKNS